MRIFLITFVISTTIFANQCFELSGEYTAPYEGDCYVIHNGRQFNDLTCTPETGEIV